MKSNQVLNRHGVLVERRDWLKQMRKKKGLTVRAVAEKLDMSWSHYSDIENNRRNPSLEVAVKIGRFYGFSAERFVSFKKSI